MDFGEIRRVAVISVFADDELMRRLVLKGGNALSLVHHIGGRTSLDVDFSLEDDFADLKETERRLVSRLTDRFDSAGHLDRCQAQRS
jgi:predicted nucleotidyltransferase component of viral defense system